MATPEPTRQSLRETPPSGRASSSRSAAATIERSARTQPTISGPLSTRSLRAMHHAPCNQTSSHSAPRATNRPYPHFCCRRRRCAVAHYLHLHRCAHGHVRVFCRQAMSRTEPLHYCQRSNVPFRCRRSRLANLLAPAPATQPIDLIGRPTSLLRLLLASTCHPEPFRSQHTPRAFSSETTRQKLGGVRHMADCAASRASPCAQRRETHKQGRHG